MGTEPQTQLSVESLKKEALDLGSTLFYEAAEYIETLHRLHARALIRVEQAETDLSSLREGVASEAAAMKLDVEWVAMGRLHKDHLPEVLVAHANKLATLLDPSPADPKGQR